MLSKKSAACRPSAIIESTGGRGVDHAVEVGGAATDTDPFLLHIYAALAEKERALISRRTKDALAAAKARGVVIGGLREKGRELQEGHALHARRDWTTPPRRVAQSGSAPRSGRGGRRFKSCHSDQKQSKLSKYLQETPRSYVAAV
jgi:resolvase-like protein